MFFFFTDPYRSKPQNFLPIHRSIFEKNGYLSTDPKNFSPAAGKISQFFYRSTLLLPIQFQKTVTDPPIQPEKKSYRSTDPKVVFEKVDRWIGKKKNTVGLLWGGFGGPKSTFWNKIDFWTKSTQQVDSTEGTNQ